MVCNPGEFSWLMLLSVLLLGGACQVHAQDSVAQGGPQPGVNVISVGNQYADKVFAADQVDGFMKMLADSGMQRVSIRATWSKIEPKEGEYDARVVENLRRVAEAAGRQGMKVMLDFHTKFTQGNYSRPTWIAQLPVQEGQVAVDSTIMVVRSDRAGERFLAMQKYVVESLADVSAIDVIAVMNEPFASWDRGRENVAPEMARLGEFLAAAARQMRQVNPNVRLAIRFTTFNHPWSGDPIKRFDKALILDNFDIIGLNNYFDPHENINYEYADATVSRGGSWEIFYQAMDDVKAAGKEFWVSEFGMKTSGNDGFGKPYSLERQRQYYEDICKKWWESDKRPDCVMPWVMQPAGGSNAFEIYDIKAQRWLPAGEVYSRYARRSLPVNRSEK